MKILRKVAIFLGVDGRFDAAQQATQLFVDILIRFLRRQHRREHQ